MSRVVSKGFGILLGVVFLCLLMGSPTHALDNAHVVIALVQTGDSQSANNEIIELYNNVGEPVEVTNWCLYYASASSTTKGTKLACFMPTDERDHVFLPAHGYLSLASKQYAPTIISDETFSATLSGTAGHIRLLNTDGTVIDKIAWGVTAVSPEGLPAPTPQTDMALSRRLNDTQFIDTDNNAADFMQVPRQLNLPNHQVYDEEDACGNIDGIQLFVPSDMVVDEQATCTLPIVDVCPNIIGTQPDVPSGYELRDDGLCWLRVAPLKITELLPNPTGADTGNEFIEFYNSTDKDVSLTNYVLKVGQNLETTIKFTHGEIIPAEGYFTLKNSDYSFSLVNSSSIAALQTTDGQLVDQSLPYTNPDDGDAWALIDSVWQYTNQPTPNAPNLLSFDSVDSDVADAGVALAPCAANQYRNPATGRCKLLAGQSSTLVPCKDNQYRSEETGRCRTIAATTEPKPCPAGQERNVDTGRCRKIISSSPPKADYAVLGSSTSTHHNYVLWAIIGIATLGIGYAVWEWRDEIAKSFRKMTTIFTIRK